MVSFKPDDLKSQFIRKKGSKSNVAQKFIYEECNRRVEKGTQLAHTMLLQRLTTLNMIVPHTVYFVKYFTSGYSKESFQQFYLAS